MVKKGASDCSQSNDSISTSSSSNSSSSTSLSSSSTTPHHHPTSNSSLITSNSQLSHHHHHHHNHHQHQHQQQQHFNLLSSSLQQQYQQQHQQQSNKLITTGSKPTSFHKPNTTTGSDMQNLANQLAVAAQNEMSYFHAAADLTNAYSKLQPVVAAAHLISAAAAQQQQQQQNNSIHGNDSVGSGGGSSKDLLGHFNAALKERPFVDTQSSGPGVSGRSGHHSSASSASSNSGGGGGGDVVGVGEETVRKREMRLLKNREAARECRRKKKEYIKCLENRVAVLETQNKTLIDELKSLKELYCQTGDSTQNH